MYFWKRCLGRTCPKSIFSSTATTSGSISLDPQDLYAHGGPDFPVLFIRTDFGITPYQQYGQQGIKPVTCLSFDGEFCSPPERTVARFQYSECHYSSRKDTRTFSSQVTFVVPLELRTVYLIEQTRNGNLQAALKLKALLAMHSPDDKVIETLRYAPLTELRFTIPKSEWIEKVLPGLGYGGLELLEIRMSNRAVAQQLPQAVEEIKQAQQHFLDADWERAVQRCRNAIELIVNARPLSVAVTSRFSDKINAFINDHLMANAEQAKFIGKQMNLLWEVCSPAAHPLPVISKPDADFIVRTTAALIGYCGRLLNP